MWTLFLLFSWIIRSRQFVAFLSFVLRTYILAFLAYCADYRHVDQCTRTPQIILYIWSVYTKFDYSITSRKTWRICGFGQKHQYEQQKLHEAVTFKARTHKKTKAEQTQG